MDYVTYSKNWDMIFSMSASELDKLDLESLDEEDLDALSIRLKKLGKQGGDRMSSSSEGQDVREQGKVFSVYETMLASDKENPGVEYMNIFEKVIIHRMGEKKYIKAADLLQNYLIFDEKSKNKYRNHFIRRNLGICYIFSGRLEKGEKIIKELIYESPGDFWNYHDIALEFYFAQQQKEAIYYLQLGSDKAKRSNDDFWYHFFQERIATIEGDRTSSSREGQDAP